MYTRALIQATVLAAAWPLVGAGQNLVPNGSFEDFIDCPDDAGQIENALGWERYRGSPDYFNSCDPGVVAGVPQNFIGYQVASQGTGYAGALTWAALPANKREHLGIQLSQALVSGFPVYLSLKVSTATGGVTENPRLACNDVGMRFTMQPYLQTGGDALPNADAIHLQGMPTDTMNWMLLNGIYVPDSAYEYLVIGGFHDDSLVSTALVNPLGNVEEAYAYFDEACVSYDPSECEMDIGFAEKGTGSVLCYPNPCADVCHLAVPTELLRKSVVTIIDIFGDVVYERPVSSAPLVINTLQWPTGSYGVRIQGEQHTLCATLIHMTP